MGLRIFLLPRRVQAVEVVVCRHTSEVHRSRRTASESSAAEPSAFSLEFPRENLGGCYVLLLTAFASVSSSVEIVNTSHWEEMKQM